MLDHNFSEQVIIETRLPAKFQVSQTAFNQIKSTLTDSFDGDSTVTNLNQQHEELGTAEEILTDAQLLEMRTHELCILRQENETQAKALDAAINQIVTWKQAYYTLAAIQVEHTG